MKKLAIAAVVLLLAAAGTIWLTAASEDSSVPEPASLSPVPEETVSEATSDLPETTTEIPVSWDSGHTYIVGDQDGYVTVFFEDGISLYEETGISLDELSETEQQEVRDGFTVDSLEELYGILETYSS